LTKKTLSLQERGKIPKPHKRKRKVMHKKKKEGKRIGTKGSAIGKRVGRENLADLVC